VGFDSIHSVQYHVKWICQQSGRLIDLLDLSNPDGLPLRSSLGSFLVVVVDRKETTCNRVVRRMRYQRTENLRIFYFKLLFSNKNLSGNIRQKLKASSLRTTTQQISIISPRNFCLGKQQNGQMDVSAHIPSVPFQELRTLALIKWLDYRTT
jgi:hypothetical protein